VCVCVCVCVCARARTCHPSCDTVVFFVRHCDAHQCPCFTCSRAAQVCCRGSSDELVDFVFKIFDIGAKGHLDRSNVKMLLSVAEAIESQREMRRLRSAHDGPRERTISTLSVTSKQEFEEDSTPSDAEEGLDDLPTGAHPFDPSEALSAIGEAKLRQALDGNESEQLTAEQFASWALGTGAPVIDVLKSALAMMGHTVFALRPGSLEQEGAAVMNRMRQDEATGVLRKHGNQCCLLSKAWHDAWRVHVGLDTAPPSVGAANGGAASGAGGTDGVEFPGPIDNSGLLVKPASVVEKTMSSVTGRSRSTAPRGGLRKGLEEDRDFVVCSEAVWSMLFLWYTGGPRITRPIIAQETGAAKIELYPLTVRVLQHAGSEGKRDGGGDAPDTSPSKKSKGPVISFLLMTECSRAQTIKQVCARTLLSASPFVLCVGDCFVCP
jgi:hypothetical protein